MLFLTLTAGSGSANVFRLSEDKTHLMGRRTGELPIEDNRVSRRHAELSFHGGQWNVRDLGSANGTFVNDERVEGTIIIQEGDRLEVGRHIFTCATGSADATENGSLPTPAHAAETSLALQERNRELLDELIETTRRSAATDRPADAEIQRRLGDLQRAVEAGPADVDRKLDAMEDKLDRLRDSYDARPEDPLGAKLDELRAAVLERPDHEMDRKLDALLEASRTDPDRALEHRLGELQQALETVPRDVQRQIEQITEAIETRPAPAEREMLEQILTALRRRAAEVEEDERRLGLMETRLGELAEDQSEAGPLLHRLIGTVEAGRHADPGPSLDRLHERMESLNERATAQERAFDELFVGLRVIREHQDHLDRTLGRMALEQAVPARLESPVNTGRLGGSRKRGRALPRYGASDPPEGRRRSLNIAVAAAVALFVPALVLISVNAWSGHSQSDSFAQMWRALTGQAVSAPASQGG